jgi:hypothetical protein
LANIYIILYLWVETVGLAAALTAPLPYTASKARKGTGARQADLPRAVLFDMTNDATPQETEAPESPRDDLSQVEDDRETGIPHQDDPQEQDDTAEIDVEVMPVCLQIYSLQTNSYSMLVFQGGGGGGSKYALFAAPSRL